MSSKISPSAAGARYVESLTRAYDAGRNSAADEQDGHPPICPYQRWDHRKSWTDGLRDGRALQNAAPSEVAGASPSPQSQN